MHFKLALTGVAAVGIAYFAAALWTPAHALSPLTPKVAGKTDTSLVVQIHRRHRHWRRGYAYYPEARWYRYRYRPYDDFYYEPYGYEPYYDAPRRYRYGPYFGPYDRRGWGVYDYGLYRPRFGLIIGF
ncbi:hypothetical protein [Hyphomicrobium sp.]|uniref:hypothetical protein n=1 Tax=Hyphomicrobium sp. TaxID=82 RepID=UPI002FE3242D